MPAAKPVSAFKMITNILLLVNIGPVGTYTTHGLPHYILNRRDITLMNVDVIYACIIFMSYRKLPLRRPTDLILYEFKMFPC